MIPFRSCVMRFGGLCAKDDVCNAAMIATFNVYAAFHERTLKTFPYLLRIGVEGAVGSEKYVFITRFVGRGQVALMVNLEADPPVTALAPLPRGLVVPMLRDVMIPTTSARLFRLVLHSAAAALHVTPQRIAAISLKCFAYSRDTRVRHFRIVLGSELFDAKISVVEKAQLSKAKSTDKGGRLPFGLSFKDIGASAPKPDREEDNT